MLDETVGAAEVANGAASRAPRPNVGTRSSHSRTPQARLLLCSSTGQRGAATTSSYAQWWRGGGDGGGADAVQHAKGGQPLDQMGAVDLGERRLLLVLGALAGPERADVVEVRVAFFWGERSPCWRML